MNYIYGYKNLLTGKWYVGQTTVPLEERHRLHLSGAKNKKASDYNCLFHQKIREYGIENFSLEILEQVEDQSELDEREIYWIKEKQSFVKENGYNLTTGGQKYRKDKDYIDIRAAFQTKDEILQVINDIKFSEKTFTQIAKELNVSIALISKINDGEKYHQDNETYPLRQTRSKLDENTVQLVIKFLQNNKSNYDISKILSIDSDTVYRINYGRAYWQKDLSYPIRKDLSPKEVRANKIKELLQEGKLNNKQIADIVKCDPSVVSNINYGKNYRDEKLSYPLRKVNPVSTIHESVE